MTDPIEPAANTAEENTPPTPAASTASALTYVRLGDIAIAPENARSGEDADEDIPGLAETIRAVGVLVPILARAGTRKTERPAMVLDGRRRLLALERLLAEGAITADYPVPAIFFADKVGQAAAVVVANEARIAIHVADMIVAIGKLRKRRCTVAEVAKALAYDETEIRRLMALSDLHPKALEALRQDRIDLQVARLLARIPDRSAQRELAEQALMGYGAIGYAVRQQLNTARVDVSDTRLKLVGVDRYVAAGGRVESDLFSELPDGLLDPDILTAQWRGRIQPVVERFEADGLEVFLAAGQHFVAPDGLERTYTPYIGGASEAVKAAAQAADEAFRDVLATFQGVDTSSDEASAVLHPLLAAQASRVMASNPGRILAGVALYPDRPYGVGIELFTRPAEIDAEAADDPSGAGDDTGMSSGDDACAEGRRYDCIEVPKVQVAVSGRSHILHETQTDVATRGLIRDVADSPLVAMTLLVAQLFKALVLQAAHGEDASALQVRAIIYRRQGSEPIAELDGEVRARLDRRRADYLASGLRPIPWVESLAFGDRTALMAELVAIALNMREARTTSIRHNARAEAAEAAELTGSDIARHWTPDVGYLEVHGKKQLLAVLGEMGCDDLRPATLKKAELVAFTAEQAALRGFAPKVLGWSPDVAIVSEPADGDGPDAESEAQEADIGAARPDLARPSVVDDVQPLAA